MNRNLTVTLSALMVLGASAVIFASKLANGRVASDSGRGTAPAGLIPSSRQPLPPSSMVDVDQRELADGELTRGRVLLIYLTTSCGPCVEQAQIISRLSESPPPGLRIYGVSFEQPAQVATFTKQLDLRFPILIDVGGKLAGSLNIHYFPSVYLVEDGTIIKAWRGVTRDESDFRRQLLTEN